MDAQTLHIDFIVPQGWHELTDAQLRYVYNLIALEMSSEEIAVTCLLHWSGTRVIGRQPDGAYLLQQGRTLFEVKPLAIAELVDEIRWLAELPQVPVRISSLRRKRCSGVIPWQSYPKMIDKRYMKNGRSDTPCS